MFKELYLPRWLLVYGVCVPLALMLGYLLASPFSSRSILVVGLVLVALAFPMLLRWHHPLLIFTWNAYLIVYFLPGQPSLGYTMAVVSLGFAILNRMMRSCHVTSASSHA